MDQKEEMTKKLNNYFSRTYKELADGYEVLIKPTNNLDINNNENIKSIINSIFLIDNTGKGSAQKIYKLTKALAYFLNDKMTEDELDEIVKATKTVPSAYTIEQVLDKYFKLNTKLDKKVMYHSQRYALSDLGSILQAKKTEIYMVFVRLLKENDIQVPWKVPDFDKIQNVDMGQL